MVGKLTIKCQSKWEPSCIAESVKNAAILAALNETATTFLEMYPKESFTQMQKDIGRNLHPCIVSTLEMWP